VTARLPEDPAAPAGSAGPNGEEPTPREIVAALHAEIAARSPGHAALVAAFEQIPRKPRTPIRVPRRPAVTSPHRRRMEFYTALRLSGTGKKAAARQAGIVHHTGRRYEADLIAMLGGAL
jgi:hypothetical protein